MAEAIHDVEADTGEAVARALLRAHLPTLADNQLTTLRSTGTDNALWRIARVDRPDLVLRLPRTASAADSLVAERSALEQLATRSLPVPIPAVEAAGGGDEIFPHPWAVLAWLPGDDAWAARDRLVDATIDEAIALELAGLVRALTGLDGVEAPQRTPGRRGGPIGPVLDGLDRWLDDPAWSAAELIDVAGVRRAADEAREVADDAVERRLVHGDLLPGNVLVAEPEPGGSRAGRLAAVIDWGSVGLADPAQDLTPAWAILGDRGRRAFREALAVDDATWLRGRAFELDHTVAAILYYTPRRHPLAEVMARALDRLLSEPEAGG